MKTQIRPLLKLLALLALFSAPHPTPAYYDPGVQRWITRDPLETAEIAQGPNCYAFVENDAVRHWDADGRELGYEYCCDGRMTPPIEGDAGVRAGEVVSVCAVLGGGAIFADCVAANMPRILSTCKNARCKVSIHPPHHGKKQHLDITCWIKGVKGSDIRWDIELPPW